MDDGMEFLNALKKRLQEEIVRMEGVQISASSHTERLVDNIRAAAEELRKLGCGDEQIRIAALALCGVPFKPIDTQSLVKKI